MDQSPLIDTKTLFAPKKGKQATKGQKQIYEENQATVKFYSLIAIVSILINLVLTFSSQWSSVSLKVFAFLVQTLSVYGLHYIGKPVTSGDSKTIVDGGIDLNMGGGFADSVKDIIVTTAACSVLSIFSNLFWILWLWLPCYLIYRFWVGIVAPWIFAPPPEEPAPEIADKKRRKMERKMARAGYR